MNNITVKFIDREYSLPEDLLVYLDLLDLTNDVRMALNKKFYQLLQNEEIGCIGDEQIRPEIEKQVGRFIAKLMEAGVYDRTITDYLNGNKGFELISKVNQAAFSKMKELLIQKLDEYTAGVEEALYKRDSSITGMGFSIWSSSFVNHAIYAAMEASTLNKQEVAANKEYRREIDTLHNSITSKHDGAKKTYIDSTYIPNMEAAIAVFSFELLDAYISDLIEFEKLDKSILDYIDIDRSNDFLKNLVLSPNKEAILRKAFEACPYNLQVYEETLRYGLMDYDTYQTAQYFRQDKNILLSLNENLGEVEYPSKFEVNYSVAEKIAEYTQSDVTSVLQAITKDYVASIIKAYGDVVKLLDNHHQATQIMSELSESTILSGSSVSRGKASAYINGIVSQTVWVELTEKCGYSDLLDRIKKNSPLPVNASSKDEYDKYLADQLYSVFSNECRILAAEIQKRREEVARKKAEQEKNEQEHEKRNKKIAAFVTSVIAVTIMVVVVLNAVIIPNKNYKAAVNLMNNGKYEEAIASFETMAGYKDSSIRIEECYDAIYDAKYSIAIELMHNGQYNEAISAFEELQGHMDCEDKIQECNAAVTEQKYIHAVSLMNDSKYEEAISTLEVIINYRDSKNLIGQCKDAILQAIYENATKNKYGTYIPEEKTEDLLFKYISSKNVNIDIDDSSVIHNIPYIDSDNRVRLGTGIIVKSYQKDTNRTVYTVSVEEDSGATNTVTNFIYEGKTNRLIVECRNENDYYMQLIYDKKISS